jgi:hypothetical protein
MAGVFLDVQPTPLSRIVLAFRSVDSGCYDISVALLVFSTSGFHRFLATKPVRRIIGKVQYWTHFTGLRVYQDLRHSTDVPEPHFWIVSVLPTNWEPSYQSLKKLGLLWWISASTNVGEIICPRAPTNAKERRAMGRRSDPAFPQLFREPIILPLTAQRLSRMNLTIGQSTLGQSAIYWSIGILKSVHRQCSSAKRGSP